MTNDERMHDHALLKSAFGGDQRAAGVLVDANLDRIFGLALRLLQNNAEAEEVAQESFLRLWQRADSWRPDAKIGTWLYRVTYNMCIDRIRRRKWIEPGAPPEQIDPGESAFESILFSQQQQALELGMRELSDRQRAALGLVYFDELRNTDAAEIMGVSVKALESLLWRARKALRSALENERKSLIG